MAPSYSGVWKLQTKYQYSSAFPIDTNLLPRSLIAGGNVASGSADASAGSNQVQMLQISNTANATDYGDLTVARTRVAGGGSDTRFVTAGGEGTGGGSDRSNVIDYKLYSSSGNLSDFGDLTDGRVSLNSIGNNNVRLIFAGGDAGGYHNVMQYITIASTGNTTDFGDLSVASSAGQTGIVGTTTRGISAIGINSSYSVLNTIEYVTIASAGNSTDFGDRTNAVIFASGCASSTRGIFMGGNTDGTADDNVNVIDYITMGSTGNATDFGDLSQSTWRAGGVSNATKGLYIGGSTNAGTTTVNTIDQITIGSTGNATDFADLATATSGHSAASAEFPAVQNEADFAPAAMGLFGIVLNQTTVEYINIASLGNSSLFGDASLPRKEHSGGMASTTRAITAGGQVGSTEYDTMEYFTFSTKGKATDFGNLSAARYRNTSTSNSTRGMIAGGQNASDTNVDIIEYITIGSTGNATDFGDLNQTPLGPASLNSTTRTVIAGGRDSSYNQLNVIDYVTTASTGDATDFGDLTLGRSFVIGGGSNTRGLFAGGGTSSGYTNTIDYITIGSTGNATDFGDLTVAENYYLGAMSDKTKLVIKREDSSNVLEYVTIASTGNSQDFGDALMSIYSNGMFCASNSHGGIS